MSSQLYVGCSLCAVALSPNTLCDHATFIQMATQTSENQKVIVKKSIFGDKTREEVKISHNTINYLICRCGVRVSDEIVSNCRIVEDGANCVHPKKLVSGKLICIQKVSSHTCNHAASSNTLQWLKTPSIASLRHPSGLNYRQFCLRCSGTGICIAETYKPCDICKGLGGLKCTSCPGIGYIPRDCKICFNKCPKNCDMGYKKRCLACNGEQAVVTGCKEIKCNKCVEVPKPNIASIKVDQLRPLSPSQMSKLQ